MIELMSNLTVASSGNLNVRTPMTPEAVKTLKDKLTAEMRMNVYPNVFDINLPYRVAVRYDNVITNYGNFSDIDAATCVGTIASMSKFGSKAIRGNFDADKAVASQEYQNWLVNPRSADTIAAAKAST